MNVESREANTPEPRAAGDVLPPVSPPSSQFVMQLFVIPLVIVSLIVGIWLLFHWVANRDMRPAELAQDIERLNHASWQKALTLANQLRDERNTELRQDEELCQRLASQLDKRIEEGGTDQERIWLRIYLCRALGDFELSDSFPALVRAANHQETIEDLEVRRAALQAIGILTNRVGDKEAPENLTETVIAASRLSSDDEEETQRYTRLRSTAAFVLGLLDRPSAIERLAEMLEDASEDVQFNSAVALARHGDERSVPLLVLMLNGQVTDENPESTALTSQEIAEWRSAKRQLVVTTGLRAAQKLMETQPDFDLSSIRQAITKVATMPGLDPSIANESLRILEGAKGD